MADLALATPAAPPVTGLRSDSIRLVGTIGNAVAIQAPSAGAAILPALMAGLVGISGPLSFGLAIVAMLFVAYAFTIFTREFASAGSVYAFNGTAMGSGYGFMSAWLLLAVYLAYAATWTTTTSTFSSRGDVGRGPQLPRTVAFVWSASMPTPWMSPSRPCRTAWRRAQVGRPAQFFPLHFVGRAREHMHLEKLTNLGALPRVTGFVFVAFPVKLRDGSAGWVRPVALVPASHFEDQTPR
ncbi:MAG: hypothetical protein DLM54_02265 [Acidimicrobiales bacterium]|nr:MAG: hypothetical protein DLM54_02265 [Acidimicrobiales bacterium]